MYSFMSRIRYSEVDEEKYLSVSGLINYFQDCSTFHSEDIGLGLGFLEEHHRGWVLTFWQIVIDKYPMYGETVCVGTWPYDFNGFMGSRNFIMQNQAGERLAYANSVWAYLDTQTGRFAKLGEYELERYKIEEKLDMEYADRKIKIPVGGQTSEPIVITSHQIDTNHHVNNEEYVKLAQDLLKLPRPHQIRVEYKKSAVLGDTIFPRIVLKEDGIDIKNVSEKTVVLSDEAGKPYATVIMS